MTAAFHVAVIAVPSVSFAMAMVRERLSTTKRYFDRTEWRVDKGKRNGRNLPEELLFAVTQFPVAL